MKRAWDELRVISAGAGLVLALAWALRNPGGTGEAGAVEESLLELAARTRAQYIHLLDQGEPPVRPDQAGAEEEQLLRCQAFLMELREIENELRGKGIEVDLAPDLGTWLGSRVGNLGPGREADFLQQVVEWTSGFLLPSLEGRLERLMALPDPAGSYPALAMELSGPALWIGGRIRALELRQSAWKLAEMDLQLMPQSGSWWMRGSIRFHPAVQD